MRFSMKKRYFLLLTFLLTIISCEERQQLTQPMHEQRPEVRDSLLRLTRGGTTLPGGHQLTAELSNPGSSITPHCPGCEEAAAAASPEPSTRSPVDSRGCVVGQYENIAQCREAFVQMIQAEGRGRFATTTLDLPGGRFEVFNDALTLPDGTYVNFTHPEAMALARAWGCRLPNYDQAEAIRRYAEQQGARLTARPRPWDNGVHRNMTAMMNDPEMRRRAADGQRRLINGHFKWYIDDGSNDFRFYGFYAPSACRSGYCQGRGSSGGHGRNYIDYSQSVRLICPAR
jgi:hypothetical protein